MGGVHDSPIRHRADRGSGEDEVRWDLAVTGLIMALVGTATLLFSLCRPNGEWPNTIWPPWWPADFHVRLVAGSTLGLGLMVVFLAAIDYF